MTFDAEKPNTDVPDVDLEPDDVDKKINRARNICKYLRNNAKGKQARPVADYIIGLANSDENLTGAYRPELDDIFAAAMKIFVHVERCDNCKSDYQECLYMNALLELIETNRGKSLYDSDELTKGTAISSAIGRKTEITADVKGRVLPANTLARAHKVGQWIVGAVSRIPQLRLPK